MKLQILSDTHHEFYRDLDQSWVKNLNIEDADVLILAGDIASFPVLHKTLSMYAELGLQTIYIPGNHEYYLGEYETTTKIIESISKSYDNFHYINNDTVTINGQRFVGSTLWYPDTPQAILDFRNWSDFSAIRDWPETWIFYEALKAKKFLEKTVKSDDVVVTHMLPSWQSVVPKFKTESTNCFFVHDCEKLIIEKQPKIWCHGHSHSSLDYKIANTRVVANPRGYPNDSYGMYGGDNNYENPTFVDKFIVEV